MAESVDTALDAKMSFLQRYGLKGALVLVLSLVTPYIGTLVDSYMNDKYVSALKSNLAPLIDRLDMLDYRLSTLRSGSKYLSADDIVYIARMAVAKQSINKIQEIHHLLDTHSHGAGISRLAKRRLNSHVLEVLMRNSAVYVVALNKFQQRNIGRVGDYIVKEFPMDDFVTGVYDIIYTVGLTDAQIESDILLYMLEYQQEFFTKMKIDMTNARR